MIKGMRLGVIFLAGFLALPANVGPVSQVYAQSGADKMTEKQYQDLQRKRQEQWQDQEILQKRLDTGVRRQDGEKRQRDAEKRQREAERRLQELEK